MARSAQDVHQRPELPALHWGISDELLALDGPKRRSAAAAWGARAIVTRGDAYDLPPDRVDRVGDDDDWAVLQRLMTDRIPWAEVCDRTRGAIGEDIVNRVYDDRDLHVRTRLAGGYCYVTAWLTRLDPDALTGCPHCGGEGYIDGLIDRGQAVLDLCRLCHGSCTVTNRAYDEYTADR